MVQVIDDIKLAQINQIICDKFGSLCLQAQMIALCESGGDSTAININDAKITGFNSWGLFMHNEPYFEGWDDPVISTAKAYEKFSRRFWYPWKNCATKLGLI